MSVISRRSFASSAAMLALTALAACDSTKSSTPSDSAEHNQLLIFATTGYLADAAKNIAPQAQVITMVGPGGDPHTYQPSTGDIDNLKKADVVFWQGLHMEAQMLDQLESLGDKQLAVGDQLPESNLLPWPETDDHGNPLHDPHIWNSPKNWELVVGYMVDQLSAIDPDHHDEYAANGQAYQQTIRDTADQVTEILSVVPEQSRVLISGHDAFNYFGDYFNFEVHATDFVSSEAQLSPEEISELADLITQKKVPVIFADNLANPQAITSLREAVQSRGWDVQVSDEELYADSLGESAPTDTYVGVLLHNANAIAGALGQQ